MSPVEMIDTRSVVLLPYTDNEIEKPKCEGRGGNTSVVKAAKQRPSPRNHTLTFLKIFHIMDEMVIKDRRVTREAFVKSRKALGTLMGA
jgi:hypothetical protein